MLERLLTPPLSADVITLLVEKRGWSMARVARVIGATPDYVKRVRGGMQSFIVADVEKLARECGQSAHVLIFESIRPDRMPAELRPLYESTRKVVESTQALGEQLRRKGTRKRRTRAA
jgi:hypothetical protein